MEQALGDRLDFLESSYKEICERCKSSQLRAEEERRTVMGCRSAEVVGAGSGGGPCAQAEALWEAIQVPAGVAVRKRR